MITFDSTKKVESQNFPGVTFCVRVLNHIQRAQRDAGIIKQRARAQEIGGQLRDIKPDDFTPAQREMDIELDMIWKGHLYPTVIKAGLVSIEGVEIDGKPATAESLVAAAPDALLDDIYAACSYYSGLAEQLEKNLPSPSTSAQVDGGADQSTTAPPASGSDTTEAATVPATSPAL